MSSPTGDDDPVEDGKNKYALTCTHCPSKILSPLSGSYFQEERDLPKMAQKKNAPEVEVDSIKEWFLVEDMFTFDNVGVSHVVNDMKYLTCADCEFGPIGWMDVNNKKSYVALSRVRQSTSSESA
jgi:hypothetical protein